MSPLADGPELNVTASAPAQPADISTELVSLGTPESGSLSPISEAPTQATSEAPSGSMFPVLIGVGEYLVGVDIEPGIYAFLTTIRIPPVESCYWEVGNVSLLGDKSISVFEMQRQREIVGGRGIKSTPELRGIYKADGAPPFGFIEAQEVDIWFRIWAEDSRWQSR